MKILRLTGTQPRPWAVDLHPRLTVVTGLAPEVAGPVRAAIDALVRARLSPPELSASGLGGLVAVGDSEISVEALAGWTPGLVPTSPLRGTDLRDGVLALAHGRARALDAEVASAEAEVAAAENALAALRRAEAATAADGDRSIAGHWREREEAAAALRRARRRVADAISAAADADAARTVAPGPSPQLHDLIAERDRLAGERVASARAARDAAAAAHAESDAERARLAGASHAELDALRAELADVERRCVELAPAAPGGGHDRQALVDRRAFLTAEIDALTRQHSDQVAQALTATEAHRGIAVVEAARVAVEWERVRDLAAEAAAAPAPPPPPPIAAAPIGVSEAAAARLARAHEEVSSARRAVAEASGASPLYATDVEALEAAHAEVLSAWEGSERRIGVGKARRRLEDAQLAEREILARMGFASYTEFMVSGRASGTPSALDAEEARRYLRDAEGRLAQVEALVEEELTTARAAVAPPDPAGSWDADAAQGRLSATLAALRARAVDLLGEDPGEDVAGALRDRISTDPLPDLRMALDEVGVPLGEVLSREAVLSRARDWITRARADESRRGGLESALAEIDAQLRAFDTAEGDRRAWEALVARRDALRDHVASSTLQTDAIEAAEERLARDRSEAERSERAVDEAEADARRRTAPAAWVPPAGAPAPTVDLAALEGEARDAQTALDVALSHLLSPRPLTGDDPDAALGRAEARLALAQLELDSLRAIRASRAGTTDVALDVDALVWRVLSVLASHQAAALPDGPGPAPLVLDEPFGNLSPAEATELCDALVGPARAVQVLVVTDRQDIADWARSAGPDAVALAVPSLAGSTF
ncbi:MAG TPA: hypothetical protein VK507_06360 [Iamia sp.]|nr:hypothetical protein [Iamia sp.]